MKKKFSEMDSFGIWKDREDIDNWRPLNWDKYLEEAKDNRIGISWLSDHTYRELMEIGADAMKSAVMEWLEPNSAVKGNTRIIILDEEDWQVFIGV